MPNDRNEKSPTCWWKSVSAVLGGVLLSVLGAGGMAWLAFGNNHPDRSEVRQMIMEVSPYLHDKQFIFESISSTKEQVRNIQRDLQNISTNQAKVMANQDLMLIGLKDLHQELRKGKGLGKEPTEP